MNAALKNSAEMRGEMKKSVLIVEDSKSQLEMMKRLVLEVD